MPALFEAAEARTKKLRQALDTLLAKPLPAPSFQGEEGNHADLRESPQRDVRQLEGLEDAGRTPRKFLVQLPVFVARSIRQWHCTVCVCSDELGFCFGID